jgi:hypothetical protein
VIAAKGFDGGDAILQREDQFCPGDDGRSLTAWSILRGSEAVVRKPLRNAVAARM